MRKVLTLACLLALIVVTPQVARAGDCPILTWGDWGLGEIDGKILLYLGKEHCLLTPIPAPPKGPLWDVAYRAMPFAFGGTAVFALLIRRRNSRRPTAGNDGP
jgi:hypothetical protein